MVFGSVKHRNYWSKTTATVLADSEVVPFLGQLFLPSRLHRSLSARCSLLNQQQCGHLIQPTAPAFRNMGQVRISRSASAFQSHIFPPQIIRLQLLCHLIAAILHHYSRKIAAIMLNFVHPISFATIRLAIGASIRAPIIARRCEIATQFQLFLTQALLRLCQLLTHP